MTKKKLSFKDLKFTELSCALGVLIFGKLNEHLSLHPHAKKVEMDILEKETNELLTTVTFKKKNKKWELG